MGSCTFELVFSNLLPFFIACPNQLFRNSFNFYRYNLFLCLLEPVIECRVWNIVTNAERVDGNSIGLTLGFVEEPQSFKIFFAKHNLSSFKFSTKVCERDMLVNTPILDGYLCFLFSFTKLRKTKENSNKTRSINNRTAFVLQKYIELAQSFQASSMYFCSKQYYKSI